MSTNATWRAVLVAMIFTAALTALGMHLICNAGKPTTHIYKP